MWLLTVCSASLSYGEALVERQPRGERRWCLTLWGTLLLARKLTGDLYFWWSLCLILWIPEDYPERYRYGWLKLGDY